MSNKSDIKFSCITFKGDYTLWDYYYPTDSRFVPVIYKATKFQSNLNYFVFNVVYKSLVSPGVILIAAEINEIKFLFLQSYLIECISNNNNGNIYIYDKVDCVIKSSIGNNNTIKKSNEAVAYFSRIIAKSDGINQIESSSFYINYGSHIYSPSTGLYNGKIAVQNNNYSKLNTRYYASFIIASAFDSINKFNFFINNTAYFAISQYLNANGTMSRCVFDNNKCTNGGGCSHCQGWTILDVKKSLFLNNHMPIIFSSNDLPNAPHGIINLFDCYLFGNDFSISSYHVKTSDFHNTSIDEIYLLNLYPVDYRLFPEMRPPTACYIPQYYIQNSILIYCILVL